MNYYITKIYFFFILQSHHYIMRYLSLKIFRELYLKSECSRCGLDLHKKKTPRPEKDLAASRVGKKKT